MTYKYIEINEEGFNYHTCLDYGLWRISHLTLAEQSDSVNIHRCIRAKIPVYTHEEMLFIPTWVACIIWDLDKYWFKKKLGPAIKVAGIVCQNQDLKDKYSSMVTLLLDPERMTKWSYLFSVDLLAVREYLLQDLEDKGYEVLGGTVRLKENNGL